MRMHSRSAFTLIELIAVMAVTALLALAAIPAVARTEELRAAAAARRLLADCADARRLAVAEGRTHWLELRRAMDGWTVLAVQPDGSEAPAVDGLTGRSLGTVLATDGFPGIRVTDVDVPVSGPPVRIGFDWRGRTIDRNGRGVDRVARITLTAGHRVCLEPVTGLASLEE